METLETRMTLGEAEVRRVMKITKDVQEVSQHSYISLSTTSTEASSIRDEKHNKYKPSNLQTQFKEFSNYTLPGAKNTMNLLEYSESFKITFIAQIKADFAMNSYNAFYFHTKDFKKVIEGRNKFFKDEL